MMDSFMPYSTYLILHRALPLIDGFKPSQRRVLYSMYERGYTHNKPHVKSNSIGGDVMKIHPHGSTYETLVRMTNGHNAFNVPFIESKGSFGKVYSRDSRASADRYTSARLNKLSTQHLFTGIDKGAVEMIDTYDGSQKEPLLLPVAFPTILTNGISGMAVGMATNIPPFNFHEVINYTIAKLKDEGEDIIEYIKAPDFPIENTIVYDEDEMRKILTTGRGSFKVRGTYTIEGNTVTFHHVPHITTYESILDSIADLVKDGKLPEVVNTHDRYGMKKIKGKVQHTTGIKIVAKKNTNMEELVNKLFLLTRLEETFSVNLNIVLDNKPQVLGVPQVIEEWIKFRIQTVRNMSLTQKQENELQLEKLLGLVKIQDSLEQVVSLVRKTQGSQLIQALQDTFELTQIQAEYIANLQIRSLTEDVINERTKDIQKLRVNISALEKILTDDATVSQLIIKQLEQLNKEFPHPRRTNLIDKSSVIQAKAKVIAKANEIEEYNVRVFITEEHYVKKIPLTSMRGNTNQRLKDGDKIVQDTQMTNLGELLVFTNKHNVHKKRLSDLEDSRPPVLGDYLPTLLDLEKGEEILFTVAIGKDFKEHVILGFDDGNVAVIDSKAYATKQNRSVLKNGYHKDKTLTFVSITQPESYLVVDTTDGYRVAREVESLSLKSSRNVTGNIFVRLNEGSKVKSYKLAEQDEVSDYIIKSAGRGKRIS